MSARATSACHRRVRPRLHQQASLRRIVAILARSAVGVRSPLDTRSVYDDCPNNSGIAAFV